MRTPTVRRAIAVVCLVASVFAATTALASAPGTLDAGAGATRQATRVAPVTSALLISDSAWLGMHLYGAVDSVQGFEHSLALASCRRRVATSCRNFDGFVPITLVDELEEHPDGFNTLVVATGYNDDDRRFAEEVDEVVELARSFGYRRIVWLTLRSNVTYTSPDAAGFAEVFERSNAMLNEIVAASTYPELVIADWATYAEDHPEWFSSDGIHLRTLGGFAAGDYLSRKMAFLDGRPCPLPIVAGQAPVDPCPDPDVRGPVTELALLFPVTDTERPRFVLRWEGSSSWPEAPYWER